MRSCLGQGRSAFIMILAEKCTTSLLPSPSFILPRLAVVLQDSDYQCQYWSKHARLQTINGTVVVRAICLQEYMRRMLPSPARLHPHKNKRIRTERTMEHSPEPRCRHPFHSRLQNVAQRHCSPALQPPNSM